MPVRAGMLFIFLFLGVTGASVATAAPGERPNILFIFADDWGYGDLSYHGNDKFPTPNLDQMARQGIDFRQFTVANPVCSPSRAAVMTGHFPARHSVHQHFASIRHHRRRGMPDWLNPDVVMLPRLFQEAGYATAHFGKWHLTNRHVPDAPLPKRYGYDEAAVFNGPGEHVPANPRSDEPLMTDKAIDFMEEHQDEPFFINLWLHATHVPHYPTEKWLKRLDHLEKRERVYGAVVAEADHRIGEVLATLDRLELSEETLVIFSSDNGPEIPAGKPQGTVNDPATGTGLGRYYSVGTTAGRRGQKRSLYNGGVGTPFIVRWPGETPSGEVNDTTAITSVDLLPTFCAAADIELPDGYQPDGQNMLPALKGESITRDKPIFWDWRGARHGPNWPRMGVRDGPWKLLTNYDESRVELYNIHKDPRETNNLVEKRPKITKKLIRTVKNWRKSLPEHPPRDCFSRKRK